MSIAEPTFSVITPVYDTPADVLRACLDSVLAQTYESWELLVTDDASPSDHVRPILEEYAERDARITINYREVNGGIVAATNDAFVHARGEFIALLDHDDLLDPRALEKVANVLDDEVDVVYTDEDKTVDGRSFFDPFRKPEWSPERLRSHMYVLHLAAYRTDLVREVGGFRSGYDGSQDYDLCLRVTEKARRIVHVPEILYHWRIIPTSVAGNPDAKPYAYVAARRAIGDQLERLGVPGRVEMLEIQGNYRIHREVRGNPLVSIVIPTRGSSGVAWGRRRCFVVEAVRGILERSTYDHLELVVVADSVTPSAVRSDLEALATDRLRWIDYDKPFNFADKMNKGVVEADGEFVVLLNDDVDLITADWIETMLGLAQQDDVGMVGVKLYFEDDTVQHIGHCYWSLAPGHIGFGAARNDPGPLAEYVIDREVSGVTGACAMLRRSVYFEVGGLSYAFPSNYNDVDLSLKIRETGRRIVVTPHVELYHFESKSREPRILANEAASILARWARLMAEDPYWRTPLMI